MFQNKNLRNKEQNSPENALNFDIFISPEISGSSMFRSINIFKRQSQTSGELI